MKLAHNIIRYQYLFRKNGYVLIPKYFNKEQSNKIINYANEIQMARNER